MVRSINNIYEYNGDIYTKRSSKDAWKGYVIGSLASGLIASTIPVFFQRPISKAIPQAHKDNRLFKKALSDSFGISGLDKKGVIIEQIDDRTKTIDSKLKDVINGTNAFYSPNNKTVYINKNKLSIAGFHELGHAMNHLDSKFGKVLQKMRGPGVVIAGWMGMVALFSKNKVKGEKRNLWDWFKENCGAIAFCSLLPIVGEEALASHKGLKLAQKAGLSKAEIKKIRTFNAKALLTYIGYAIVTGLSVGVVNHFMDVYTRPKKIGNINDMNV